MYSFLSGGTGTPKLLQGFRELVSDDKLGVICNTGDDLNWFGIHVSPDLDTVLYLFSERLDETKFWGVKNETYHALATIKSLKGPAWFNIGDRDLGLHVFRQFLLKTLTLSETTEKISDFWGIDARIYPMSDFPLRSLIYTDKGTLPFQEFFVKHKAKPQVEHVEFEGQKDEIPPQVINLLDDTNQLIIGPSNPVTSIGPILSLTPLNEFILQNRDRVTAISPIVGNKAFSGPSVKLMNAVGIEPSVIGLADHYKDHISKLIISEEDRSFSGKILDLGIEPITLPIKIQTLEEKKTLARSLRDLL